MSLHPLKKSDIGKDWMSKRRDNTRLINPEYHLIITEGIKTEPNYFNAIKERINSKYKERIYLEVFGEGTNTVDLYKRATERAKDSPNGYKHVWIVYDTDDFPYENINKVPELCKNDSSENLQYHAIWSNQCIELWFLLHFSYLQSDLHRDEYYPKLTNCLIEISGGSYKKNRDDIFATLFPYIKTAIINAKKLNIKNKGKTPSLATPGTKIYELIEKLMPYL